MQTANLQKLFIARAALKRSNQAHNTQKAYAQSWKGFSLWCQQAQRNSLPATTETVSLYLTDLLGHGRKVSTAVSHTSSITWHHREAGHPTPITAEIWELLNGAKRMLLQQPHQMAPLSIAQLTAISAAFRADATKQSIRNRALIVLGFTTALRRSNIVELDLADIAFTPSGVIIRVRKEKQDQQGRGRNIGVPPAANPDLDLATCLHDWLSIRGLAPGPLFLRILNPYRAGEYLVNQRLCGESGSNRGRMVGLIVKGAVKRIGIDPGGYGGHSLRAGFITAAAEAGVGELLISTQSGHKSMDILRKYFRKTDLWRSNPCGLLNL